MIGPLLRLEVRRRLGRGSWPAALLVWSAGSLGLGLLTLAAGRLLAMSDLGAFRAAVLIQATAIPLLAVWLTVPPVTPEPWLFLSRFRSATILLGRSVLPVLAAVSAVLCAGLPLWTVAGGAARPVLRAELVLCAAVMAALALGLLCSTVFRELSTAAGAATLIVLFCAAAPLLAGPFVERTSDAGALIDASLRLSPWVAVSSALDFDILRTESLYSLSPIGQRRFTYPAPAASSGLFLAFSVVAFALSVGRFAAGRRNLES